MQIDGRVFLVTGAGSGLGAGVARALAAGGGRCALMDRDGPRADALAAELGDAARAVPGDVTSEADGARAVAATLDAFGRLDGLVNCAGIVIGEKVAGRDGPHRLDSFARTIGVNLVGTFNMIRLAVDAMAKGAPGEDGERGVVVTTASVAAFDGQVGQAAYAASKGGVAAMTLPLARELARSGIRVVCIAPGVFETPMMASLPADAQAALGRSVPFPARLGRAEEFAALVRHVCENRMLNGEVIRLDGALRMAAR